MFQNIHFLPFKKHNVIRMKTICLIKSKWSTYPIFDIDWRLISNIEGWICKNEIYELLETAEAQMLKIPEMTREPHASHLLPHRSRTSVRNVSAGSSVAAAIVNVTNTSRPKLSTFRTWPSNTKEIAILYFVKQFHMIKEGTLSYFMWEANSLFQKWSIFKQKTQNCSWDFYKIQFRFYVDYLFDICLIAIRTK